MKSKYLIGALVLIIIGLYFYFRNKKSATADLNKHSGMSDIVQSLLPTKNPDTVLTPSSVVADPGASASVATMLASTPTAASTPSTSSTLITPTRVSDAAAATTTFASAPSSTTTVKTVLDTTTMSIRPARL